MGAADTVITSGKWSVDANWSTGTKAGATDTAIHKTGILDTADENFSLAAFRSPPVSGTFWWAGRKMTFADFMVDSCTGTAHYGDTVLIAGATGYFRNSAGNGTRTTNGTSLIYNGVNCVHDEHKGNTYLKIIVGDGAGLTLQGSANIAVISDVTNSPLTFINGGSLTVNRQVTFTKGSSAGDIISIVSGTPTITGNSNLILQGQLAGATFTIPALTLGGTIALRLNSTQNNGVILQHTGALSCYELYVRPVTGSVQWSWDANDNNITCTNMYFGSAVGTSEIRTRWGNGTYTISGKLDGSTNNLGTNIDSLEGAVVNVAGNVSIGTAHAVVPGTSVITVTGAGTTTLNGKRLNDYTINNTGATYRTHADACTTNGDFTRTDGKLNMAGYPIWSAGDVSIAGNDSAKLAKINAGGLLYFGLDAIPTFTTDSLTADTLHYASLNADSIRGTVKVRKAKIKATAKFNQITGSKIVCSTCNGVDSGGHAITVIYPTTGPISYASSPDTVPVGVAITPLVLTQGGCDADSAKAMKGVFSGIGIFVTKATGAITGTPTKAGTFTDTVRVWNNAGADSASVGVTLVVISLNKCDPTVVAANPVIYSFTQDTCNCSKPLYLRDIDSMYVKPAGKILVTDSVTYDAAAKIAAGTGSKILSVPLDTLWCRMNGHTDVPQIIKRGATIRWR
jgi:hypothetical protein